MKYDAMVMAKYDSLISFSHLRFYNVIAKSLSVICMHIAVFDYVTGLGNRSHEHNILCLHTYTPCMLP